ncbi:hypothetical protein HH310_12440 [Actinoplanes sp. TBRC 11911]|uniref:hypothetical protein n=1 Tax=Actinoplanes sp. TBRC 11911 TaxID=2729386 RepID=UPI00145DEB6E|nr:hypothetical protein [Actinoplanes sp. TBRC 11911]NMO52002.1 hypothetical protein [Actinoplanes sp. TBRC 11911]
MGSPDLSTEQPAPVPNDRATVQGLVREDLRTRERIGVERYGTPLQPHNGRDALRDAYEEALDLACYLRQAIAERTSDFVSKLSEADRRLNIEGRLHAVVSGYGGEQIIAGPAMAEMVHHLANATELLARDGFLRPAPPAAEQPTPDMVSAYLDAVTACAASLRFDDSKFEEYTAAIVEAGLAAALASRGGVERGRSRE